MIKCPYCAEEIQDEAMVCRYCGKDLKSYQEYWRIMGRPTIIPNPIVECLACGNNEKRTPVFKCWSCGKLFCYSCGKPTKNGIPVIGKVNSPVGMQLTCPKCGKEMPADGDGVFFGIHIGEKY